jgi:hypothetical protein
MAAAEDPSAEALDRASRQFSVALRAEGKSARKSAGEPAMPRGGLPNVVRPAFPGPAHRLRPLRTVRTLQRRSPLARARRPEADRLPRRTDGRLPAKGSRDLRSMRRTIRVLISCRGKRGFRPSLHAALAHSRFSAAGVGGPVRPVQVKDLAPRHAFAATSCAPGSSAEPCPPRSRRHPSGPDAEDDRVRGRLCNQSQSEEP